MHPDYDHERNDNWPSSRAEAIFELVAVTPFTILRRVLNVVIGPARARAFLDAIGTIGGSTD